MYQPPAGRFETTQWSLVLAAVDRQSAEQEQALADLCQRYWYPLYVFVRRQVRDAHEAQDLTQGFFLSMLDRQALRRADPRRGRFRSFLLQSMRNYIANEWDKRHAKKRGGGQTIISLDLASAEHRYRGGARVQDTPDREFDRQWAIQLLTAALKDLEAEYRQRDKGPLFDELRTLLTGTVDHRRYTAIAERLGMTVGAVRVSLHRLKSRFGELARHEIEQTVEHAELVEHEIHDLFAAFEDGSG